MADISVTNRVKACYVQHFGSFSRIEQGGVMNCDHDWVVIEKSTGRVTGNLKSLFAVRRVCLKCHEIDDQIEACRRRDEERAAKLAAEKEAEAARVAIEMDKERKRLDQALAIFNVAQMVKAAKQAAKVE